MSDDGLPVSELRRRAVREDLRSAASRAADAALHAVDPHHCVRRALEADPLPGPCRILALGKAALGMVEGARAVLGSQLRGGVAVVPAASELPRSLGPVALLEGAHPLPDDRSVAAGRRLLEEAAGLAPDETALVLLSGGASSLAAVPIEGTTVEALAELSETLLRSGAAVSEINRLRSAQSRLHAGGLSAAIGTRSALTLAISDVPGDHAADIGSAPMHEDAPLGERRFEIVASGRLAALAAAASLRAEGFLVELDSRLLELAATSAAEAALRKLRASGSGARALIAWGEAGVRVETSGRGGRCSHAALAAARALAALPSGSPELVFLARASDGVDGASGGAGGLVDLGSWARARAGGRSPLDDLEGWNSGWSLEASGDLRPEAPTGTNVADLWLLLREEGDRRLVPLEEAQGLRLPRALEGPGPSLLALAAVQRALVAVTAAPGSDLEVQGAWDPADESRADGAGVVLGDVDDALAKRLREFGFERVPLARGRWRLGGSPGALVRPSWS